MAIGFLEEFPFCAKYYGTDCIVVVYFKYSTTFPTLEELGHKIGIGVLLLNIELQDHF